MYFHSGDKNAAKDKQVDIAATLLPHLPNFLC